MSKNIKCNSCNTKYYVFENKVGKQSNPIIEKAFCPTCKTEIYSTKIDGWLTVEILDQQKENGEKCVYPMP